MLLVNFGAIYAVMIVFCRQLALHATMSAAILAITPHPPNLAVSAWLGGAGLSVCGLFIVQYFPIQAFSITDEDMARIVEEGNHYINTALLASAIASPAIMALWSLVLFLIGIIDYIVEIPLCGGRYRIFALVPVVLGTSAVIAALTIGGMIGRGVEARVRLIFFSTGVLTHEWACHMYRAVRTLIHGSVPTPGMQRETARVFVRIFDTFSNLKTLTSTSAIVDQYPRSTPL
jgi:hypothetical protein